MGFEGSSDFCADGPYPEGYYFERSPFPRRRTVPKAMHSWVRANSQTLPGSYRSLWSWRCSRCGSAAYGGPGGPSGSVRGTAFDGRSLDLGPFPDCDLELVRGVMES